MGKLVELILFLYWKLTPSVKVRVKWPSGNVIVTPDRPGWDWTLGATLQEIYSANPQDHYGPWLEEHVGSQFWDWDWNLEGNDAAENMLTITIQRKKAHFATIVAMKWN